MKHSQEKDWSTISDGDHSDDVEDGEPRIKCVMVGSEGFFCYFQGSFEEGFGLGIVTLFLVE